MQYFVKFSQFGDRFRRYVFLFQRALKVAFGQLPAGKIEGHSRRGCQRLGFIGYNSDSPFKILFGGTIVVSPAVNLGQ